MRLSETFVMPKTTRYANPKNDGYFLPFVYGDATVQSTAGVWQAQLIDTVNNRFCIAAHAILPIASGNTVKVYDANGNEITSGFSIIDSSDLEGQGTIAYLEFVSAPSTDIFVRCKGKVDLDGNLIENPVDIIEDLLDVMDIDEQPDSTSFAIARDVIEDNELVISGIMQQDNLGQFWINQILASVLGDFWINGNQNIVISLERLTEGNNGNIGGWLREDYYIAPQASRKADNIVNQAVISFAPNYANIDRRFTEGVQIGLWDGFDDGEATKDTLSQNKYGIRKQTFEFSWIRDPETATYIQERLIALYSEPIWIFAVTEEKFRNIQAERGDYIVASWNVLRDNQKRPLVNQIWRVLEATRQLNNISVQFLLLDTGDFYPEPPIKYSSQQAIGDYNGRTRELRRIID